jgi:hypothetical protein
MSAQMLRSKSTESGGSEEHQLAWQFELRLLRLLPTVLLPCASSMLLPAVPRQTQKHGEGLVPLLLDVSTSALQLSGQLHGHFIMNGMASAAAPQAACVQGCLIALLRLTDKLLYQQPPTPADTSAASLGSQRSSGSTSTGRPCPMSCARQLLLMLVRLAHDSQYPGWNPGSNHNSTSSSDSSTDAAAAFCSNAAVVLPPLAAAFVEFVTALEAALRATSEAMQSGVISTCMLADAYQLIGSVCSAFLLSGDKHASMLLQPMGLRGPAALAKEQQQLYSLLSTLLKLRCCVLRRDGGQRCLGQQMVASCCLAAGQAAVALLKMASGPAGAGGSQTDQQSQMQAGAAAAQQPALSYLPSLVILGRCLLQWAAQLQQPALIWAGFSEKKR